MVDPAALLPLVPPLVTGLVGFGSGYALHKFRIKVEDSKDLRDKICGPLLAKITGVLKYMEQGPQHFDDALEQVRPFVNQGRLNPKRLTGLKSDVLVVQRMQDEMRAALSQATQEINTTLQRMLRDKVRLVAVLNPETNELGAFPYDEFRIEEQIVAYKDWSSAASGFKRGSSRREWNILGVVDWDAFFADNRSAFDGWVEAYLKKRDQYMHALSTVKGALEGWTSNIYGTYRSAIPAK